MTNKASVVPKEVRVQEILSRVNEVQNSFMWQVRYKLSTYWNRWQRGSEEERCSCKLIVRVVFTIILGMWAFLYIVK